MTFNPSRRQVFARSFSTRESTLVSQATFFGPKAPAEVTSIVPFLTQLEKPLFQRILQFVIEYMRGTEITESHWSKLREKVPEAKSRQLPAIFTGVYTILKTAVKTKIDATQFRTDMNSLNIPDELAQELTLAFQSLTGRLSKSVRTAIVVKPQSIRLPTIRNFQWRIDVGVTTSWARKMIRTYPSILVRITTTDGRYHQFEMTVTKFHQLRYTIARLLKEFNNLENHPILRIDKQ